MTNECSVDECGERSVTRGWCNRHYLRWRRHGDPTTTKQAADGAHAAFVETAMATATDKCVEWPYVTNKSGYPILKWEGTTHLGTTVVATLAHGPKMEGAECRHLCGRRRCLNPAHLRWGTKVEQWQDRRRHGTA